MMNVALPPAFSPATQGTGQGPHQFAAAWTDDVPSAASVQCRKEADQAAAPQPTLASRGVRIAWSVKEAYTPPAWAAGATTVDGDRPGKPMSASQVEASISPKARVKLHSALKDAAPPSWTPSKLDQMRSRAIDAAVQLLAGQRPLSADAAHMADFLAPDPKIDLRRALFDADDHGIARLKAATQYLFLQEVFSQYPPALPPQEVALTHDRRAPPVAGPEKSGPSSDAKALRSIAMDLRNQIRQRLREEDDQISAQVRAVAARSHGEPAGAEPGKPLGLRQVAIPAGVGPGRAPAH